MCRFFDWTSVHWIGIFLCLDLLSGADDADLDKELAYDAEWPQPGDPRLRY